MCQPLKGQNTHGRAHFSPVQIIEQIIVSRYHNYMLSHLFYYIIMFYDIAGYHFQWHLIVFVGLGPLIYLKKKKTISGLCLASNTLNAWRKYYYFPIFFFFILHQNQKASINLSCNIIGPNLSDLPNSNLFLALWVSC